MLISIAVGDAYGAAFEYASEMQQFNDLKQYYKHPRHNVAPGQYTDDTQMSLAIAELLMSVVEIDKLAVATAFVNAFQRDRRDGYARGFQSFLESVKDAEDFLDRIKPDSDKSGAAMRAMPIGVITEADKVLRVSEIQATVTHNTEDGVAAAKASALGAHYMIYALGHTSDLGRYLDYHIPGYKWDEEWSGKVKSKGWMAVQAAVTAVKRNNRQSDLLKDCIAFTGDTDTVAAIAMGIASESKYYIKDITADPSHPLMLGLENGDYGRDYLEALSDVFMFQLKGLKK